MLSRYCLTVKGVLIEQKASELLSTVSWGALLELRLDNNKVIELNVLSDWSADMPID